MGLTLTAQDVAALEGRTEGWIAALQLAALSMQGRDDIAGFIAGFAGDDRYIVDYLVEEVLQRQPEPLRNFLLQTSILSRLSGPLCDAVTGRTGGKAMLEALDRGNLFLVPLDDHRRWYRYHHLFADVLRARLLDEQPGDVPELHRRASDWYEQNGERSEAIRHAMAARTSGERRTWSSWRSRRRSSTGRRRPCVGWLEALPDEVIPVRPVLSNAYAGSILVRGEVEGVEVRLRDAERWLDRDAAPPDMVVVGRGGAFARSRRRSPSTGPGRPGSSATWPAPWPMPGGRWTSSAKTIMSRAGRPPRCWVSRTGRPGIWTPRTLVLRRHGQPGEGRLSR